MDKPNPDSTHLLTYLSAADAAHILGVTPASVRLMCQRGDLALAAKTEGGMHLFQRIDVERLAVMRAARPVRDSSCMRNP